MSDQADQAIIDGIFAHLADEIHTSQQETALHAAELTATALFAVYAPEPGEDALAIVQSVLDGFQEVWGFIPPALADLAARITNPVVTAHIEHPELSDHVHKHKRN